MMMPREVDAAVRRLAPGLFSGGPVLLALQSAAIPELLLASMPSARPDWTPASQWLSQQRGFQSAPVVPLYLGKSKLPLIGQAIRPAALAALPDTAEQLRYVRWRTSLLAERGRPASPAARQEPIAPAVAPELIEAEVATLGLPCRMAVAGDLEVYLAPASRIPYILLELGRLRETTFRAAGEGTGRASDLDRFDQSYLHLFLWNREAREIAGAYRLRLTAGVTSDLYTATLFDYGQEFLERLGPAIELGRSFIRAEYQKSFAPLLLLWKSIGRFVADNPAHKTLFGPVSISNKYQSISRELMIAFLERQELLADLARLVRPRHAPPRRSGVTVEFCRTLEDLSELVADLEPGQQGVPVLLRHYLRLGGKLLGFNVDRDFANALDGLIVVDLTRTDPRLLDRYLGKAETAALLAHHQLKGNHGTLQNP